jgi:transcription termination factor Rho
MSIFDQSSLEASSLADLHAIASELSIDGYRRLRKAELIDAILARQSGEKGAGSTAPAEEESEDPAVEPDEAPSGRRRRGRRGGRGRGSRESASDSDSDSDSDSGSGSDDGRGAGTSSDDEAPAMSTGEVETAKEPEAEMVDGVVELLPGGSGFVRINPPEPSDDDVYVSAAQARRCELVSGDRISGPRRPPRRSERFASLVRVDAVNGQPVSELSEAPRFEDLPATFPTERLQLGSEDPTIKAIEWLAPIGRGSRVTIVGAPRAGKTEALRRLARELVGQEDLQLWLVLAGTRPEELSDWSGVIEPTAAAVLGSSLEARNQAVEVVIEQVRRLVSRGAHAVVLVDSLDAVQGQVAARALASARNVGAHGPDGKVGGSLTVIGTASEPRGGETTVIALDPTLAGAGRFPALDLVESWTLKPELLVGDAAAEAILQARAEALQ